MSRANHPVGSIDPKLGDFVYFVPFSYVGALPIPWPRCQEIEVHPFPTADDLVVANSHAWLYQCARCVHEVEVLGNSYRNV